jgi:hypothetical protein
MASYDMIVGVIATIVFTVLLLVIYKFVVNPQTVYNAVKTQCPDAWTFNSGSRLCEPTYPTHCTPFDPKAQTLQTDAAKCNVAQSCGSFWSGYCP